MQTEIDPRDLIGHKAVDRHGDKIGTVDEVYLDDATGQPEWAAVRTGLFGRDAFVPLTSSEFVSDELRVPYDKSKVKDSPDFGVGQHLSPAQELQLYRYYGLDVPAGEGANSGSGLHNRNGSGVAAPAATAATAVTAATTATTMPSAAHTEAPPRAAADTSRTAAFMAAPAPAPAAAPAPAPAPAPATAPAPTAAHAHVPHPDLYANPLTDHPSGPKPGAIVPDLAKAAAPAVDPGQVGVPEPIEFVCREERLDIATEWHVLGRARLRKYVTSEQVERRVPVIRERIRVERVPVTAEERAQLSDQEISESTEEVTLHEQRVIVRKAVVPVERIRLVTERFTEEEVVRDEVHREHIQVHDSTRPDEPTPVQDSAMSAPSAGSSVPSAASAPAPHSAPPAPSASSAPSMAPSGPPAQPDLPGHALRA
ncbi:uncharacterized protein (TIGR02271 family) [Streptacidiphilus sp. MAP12-16]|uniref:DUF2382 domain-containing protein n=1 Tax=Streptacidiphilus sp. MAP12-16 TaxID=3156300 RepID=UPI0035166360